MGTRIQPFRTYHLWKIFDNHCYQNVFERTDLNQNMMADIQGKSKSLADEIVEQRMVIFMEKRMKKK